MLWGLIAAASAAFALGPSGAAVSPRLAPGPWRQVGAAVTSRPGKALHFYRTPQNPKAVGIVVRSTSSRPIRLFWASYCEFESDDVMTGESQDTATGVHLVVAYPPVLDNATLCYVWVTCESLGPGQELGGRLRVLGGLDETQLCRRAALLAPTRRPQSPR